MTFVRRPILRALPVLLLSIVAASCLDDGSPTVPGALDAPAASAVAPQATNFMRGQILVALTPGAAATAVAAGAGNGVSPDRPLGGDVWIFRVPAQAEAAMVQALSRNPNVRFAELDYIRTIPVPLACDLCTLFGGNFMGYKWDLENTGVIQKADGTVLANTGAVDADMDWQAAYDSLGADFAGSVKVAILDTGIRADHESLVGRIVAGYNFHANTTNYADDQGHGTHVAGIVGARAGGHSATAGNAWGPNVQFLVAKICGNTIFGYGCPDSAIYAGINWAVAQGAKVLNLSIGGATMSNTVRTALQNALANNALPVCAAGNESASSVSYPAAFPECVAVTATNWSDGFASYSNYGSQVDLSAPGGDTELSNGYSYILSSYYSSPTSYAFMAGTSMAAPQVTGLAALLYSQGMTTPSAVLQHMKNTADDLGAAGFDTRFGYGRINVGRAIAQLNGPPPPPPGNQAPTADFTHSCTALSCSFTDTSTDSDGTVTAWSWNFGDGSTSTDRNPTHTFATEASYTVTLTATDDDGATNQRSRTLNLVSNPALITADFSVSCTNLACQFTNLSSHRNGVNMLANWDLGDGSGMQLEWSPAHTYAQPGTYVVIMVVLAEDFSGWASKRDTITLPMSSPPPPPTGPTAGFTYSCTFLSCTFTDASTAGSGAITARSWSFGDGTPAGSGTSVQHTFANSNTYSVTLTVTDANNLSDPETQSVTVAAAVGPTAGFTYSCTFLACTFTDASTAGSGAITARSWNFGDGTPAGSGTSVQHTFASANTYSVTLTVTDANNLSDPETQSVTVAAAVGPTAGYTYSCTFLACTFTDASSAGSGAITSRSWNFGDGTPAGSGTSVQHTFASSNTYSVTLTVTDANNLSDPETKSVTVAGPVGPTAGYTYSCAFLTCTFTDATTAGSGAITSRSWNFGDGTPAGSGTSVQHTFASANTYSVTLTVTDANNLSDPETKSVTVSAQPVIALGAVGYKVKGRLTVDLTWSGATTSQVAIIRNGVLVTLRPNSVGGTNTWTHATTTTGSASWTYKVCEVVGGNPTSLCSPNVQVVF